MRSGFAGSVPTIGSFAFFASVLLAAPTPAEAQDNSEASNVPPPVCAFVADHAGDQETFARHLRESGIFDANNDGVADTVERRIVGSAGATTHVVTFETGETLDRLEFRDEDMGDWLRRAYGIAWLDYDGEIYRLFFEDGNGPFVWAVARLAPDNLQDVICQFDNVVVERLYAQSDEPTDVEICRWFAGNQGVGVVEFEASPPLTAGELDRSSPGSRHYPRGLAELDFDNDGQNEHLMAIDISSGAGRGCDLAYFDLTDSEGSDIVGGPKRDLLMALQGVDLNDAYPHRRCRGISRFLRHRGETYFEARYRDETPSRGRDLYHWVRSAHDGRVTTNCEATFSVQTSVR